MRSGALKTCHFKIKILVFTGLLINHEFKAKSLQWYADMRENT